MQLILNDELDTLLSLSPLEQTQHPTALRYSDSAESEIRHPRRLCPKWRVWPAGGGARQVQLTVRADRREGGRESVLSAPPDTRRRDTIVAARLDGGRRVYINRRHVDRPSGLSLVLRYCMHATRARGVVLSYRLVPRASALPTTTTT